MRKFLSSIVLVISFMGCAPRTVEIYESTKHQISSLGSELIPMDDEEVQKYHFKQSSRQDDENKKYIHSSYYQHNKNDSSYEEITVISSSTDSVIQTIPLPAPNSEVIFD